MFRLLLSVLSLVSASCVACAQTHLELCGTIPLPGVEGRLDHFAVDSKAQRLFVAALGNNSLEIVGLREGRRLQSISGMKKPTGLAYLPRRNRLYVANGEDGTLRIYDAGNYQTQQIIPALQDADNVRYDPDTDSIYVGYGKGALAVVDASQGQVITTIKLKAHPESFQLDSAKQMLFVNVPEAKHVAVIDLKKRDLSVTWSLDRYPVVFPMALDQANHRLLLGCRRPARLVVMDSLSGKILTEAPISGDTDDLFFDGKRRRVYVSCGEGSIDVLEQTDPDHYKVLEKVTTAPGARTSIFSPELDLLAVAVPRHGKQEAEIRLYRPR